MKSISTSGDASNGLLSNYKIDLIRAGIIGASFHLPHKEIFMFPFFDYLHLLFQPTPQEDPIAFSIWEGKQCIHSTFTDLYYTNKYDLLEKNRLIPPEKGIVLSEEHNLWMTIHRIRSEELRKLEKKYPDPIPVCIDSSLQTKILEPDINLMLQANMVINIDPKKEGGKWLDLTRPDIKDFYDLLIGSILHKRPVYPKKTDIIGIKYLDYNNEIIKHLDSFREILDEVFAEASSSQILQFPGHEPQLGNVFCAIRTIQSENLRLGAFPFTASLILSKNQRYVLEQWCNNRCAKKEKKCPIGLIDNENCLSDIEIPLGEESRSVADVLFCSGVIDFARTPSDNLWDRTNFKNKMEQRRVQVEQCIYPSKNASLYYVPIHMQGIPWLAIFTFSSTSVGKSPFRWLHNYTFYRDIIQRSASLLRIKIPQEYIRQLSSAASINIVSWEKTPLEVTQDINNLWRTLAQIYPFPFFQIIPPEKIRPFDLERVSGTEALDIPGRGKWVIKGINNPFFGTPQVDWGRKSPEYLLKNLIESIQASIIERSQISIEESSRSMAYSSHLLSTPMDALFKSIDDCFDFNGRDVLLKEYEELRVFFDFAMAVVNNKRWHEIQDKFDILPLRDLIKYINKCIQTILLKYSNPKIIGDQANADKAKHLLERKKDIFLSLNVSQQKDPIRYHCTQIYAVLLEIMKNAIKQLDKELPRLSVMLFHEKEVASKQGLFLEVLNSTGRPFSIIKALAKSMTHGSGDQLGVMTINLACKACGFAPPSWNALETDDGNGDMKIKVQVGTFL